MMVLRYAKGLALAGTALALAAAMAGCSSDANSESEVTEGASQALAPKGGCSMDQIHEAQKKCQGVCDSRGGSTGVHFCNAVEGGGYIAPCACVHGPDDPYSLPVTDKPPQDPANPTDPTVNPTDPNNPDAGAPGGDNCMAKPNPDAACYVAFWKTEADNLAQKGDKILAAMLTWGNNPGSPGTFSLYSPGGDDVKTKVLADAGFKAFADQIASELLSDKSTNKTGARMHVDFTDAELKLVFQADSTVDLLMGKTEADKDKTTPPVNYDQTVTVKGTFKWATIVDQTPVKADLDELGNDGTKATAIGMIKDFPIEITFTQVYNYTGGK